jgi:branched-chain amino acid transport system ATP-binding protein
LSLNEIESISEILRGLTAKGLTLVIVEHKLRELMKLVKRVIVLHYGKKIADGNPEEISRDEQVLKAYLGRRWSKPNA